MAVVTAFSSRTSTCRARAFAADDSSTSAATDGWCRAAWHGVRVFAAITMLAPSRAARRAISTDATAGAGDKQGFYLGDKVYSVICCYSFGRILYGGLSQAITALYETDTGARRVDGALFIHQGGVAVDG